MAGPKYSGAGLLEWLVEVQRKDVMWLRYTLEASEGVGLLHGGEKGLVSLLAPCSQRAAMEAIVEDLASEIQLTVRQRPA